MTEPKMDIMFLVGTAKYDPIEYRVVGGNVARPWWKFWGPREQWTVESRIVTLGPFDNYPEAAHFRDMLQSAR